MVPATSGALTVLSGRATLNARGGLIILNALLSWGILISRGRRGLPLSVVVAGRRLDCLRGGVSARRRALWRRKGLLTIRAGGGARAHCRVVARR